MKTFHFYYSLVEGMINRENMDDYRGMHRAPCRNNGAPMHDVTGVYPDDFYTLSVEQAARYYYSSDLAGIDGQSILLVRMVRNKPNATVKIYRAIPKIITSKEKIEDLENQKKYILKYGKVPKHLNSSMDSSKYYEIISDEIDKLKLITDTEMEEKTIINKGDWVTINKKYAMSHGKSNLGRYRILSKMVKAKDLYTDGNSIQEWGYDPN